MAHLRDFVAHWENGSSQRFCDSLGKWLIAEILWLTEIMAHRRDFVAHWDNGSSKRCYGSLGKCLAPCEDALLHWIMAHWRLWPIYYRLLSKEI
jgi:hypothetical protein